MGIDDIITAISRKLKEAFGDDYKRYADEVPQNFKVPCFFIQFLSLEHIRQIGTLWKVTPLFNVQYFPKKGAPESAVMTLKIQRALKEVTLLNGNVTLVSGAKSEVVDGKGHNFMRFDFFLRDVERKIFMGSLEHHMKKG